MNSRFLGAVAALLTLAGSAMAQSAQSYFPLDDGNEWELRSDSTVYNPSKRKARIV